MSTTSPRSHRRSRSRTSGLPTWSGIAIVLAALITGLLLSINAQAVGVPFLVCFAVSALVVALFTEVRGLFLTIASIPLLFGIMTVLASWTVSRSLAAEGIGAFSTTTILTALFPLAQFFPVLVGVSAAAAAIALVRVWLSGRNRKAADAAAIDSRRRSAEEDRRNRATASRARRRPGQVTVDELLERNRARQEREPRPERRPEVRPQRPQGAPPRRPVERRPRPEARQEPPRRRRFDDDLYS